MIRRSLSMNQIQSRSFRPSVNANLKVGFQSSRGASNSGHIPARLGFIGRLLIIARQRISWSPALITSELWHLFVNLGAYREILRLLKVRPFNEIAQSNPRLALKFVVPGYLARSFTVRERASCVMHHYRRMHSALPESTLRQILHGYVTLHEFHKDGNRFALTMGMPEQVGDREGELSLDLRVNSNKIFNLSFAIIPGWVVKAEVSEVLLITRLQGMLRSGSEIGLARRAYHDFFPGKLLLAALQGIADAFGICELKAVSAKIQRSYRQEDAALFRRGYDDFFAQAGMVKTASGFYSSPIPIKTKPLTSIKGRNRSRARKSRAVRQQIQWSSTEFLLGGAEGNIYSSSGAANPKSIQGLVESRPSGVAFREKDCTPSL